MNSKDLYEYNKGLKVLKESSTIFPNGSGIYKFIDGNKVVIYVGKAKNLRKRVYSYLNENKRSNRIKILISLTRQISFIKTLTELDALVLENNLIKKLKPRFNIRLMDDKSYPFIMLGKSQKWPRITKFRGKQNRKDIFFGPFANVQIVDQVLHQLERAFLLRSCSDNIFKSRKRPCVLYQIKRCSAPCVGKIDTINYASLVNEAILFLRGKNTKLKKNLVEQMELKSKKEDYEKAAILRDRVRAISRIAFEQYSDLNNDKDFDIFYLYKNSDHVYLQVFFFRMGKNLGNKEFLLAEKIFQDSAELLIQFLIFFYKNNLPPSQILVNIEIQSTQLVENIISKDKKVEIRKPKKGKKLELMKMVQDNIKAMSQKKIQNEKLHLIGLKKILNLKELPLRIEIYDNSHLSGTDAVGVMIVYENFNFSKNLYKKFNIKNNLERTSDDYFMMNQIIERRFDFTDRWKKDLPNLIIVDGGKGQLNTVKKVLAEKNIFNIDVLGIAKGDKRNPDNDKIYFNNQKISFEGEKEIFFFLQKMRDEAHRFAVSSHQIKRRKKISKSIFDKINGVGKKTKYNLLSYFGSIENIKSASLTDLKKAPGVGTHIAQQIYREFNKIV